jgi:hypothetical protein
MALLCPQEREHGEDAAMVVGGGVQVEPGEMLCTCASTVLGLRYRRSPVAWLESGPRP